MTEAIAGKIRAFLWMSVALILAMWVATKSGTDSEIALSSLRAIGIGGLFTIGGQTLVDSVANIVKMLQASKEKVKASIDDKAKAE